MIKKAVIKYKEVRSYISEFECPYCKVYVVGAGISEDVTRFNCSFCKKEIIVSDRKYVSFKQGKVETC